MTDPLGQSQVIPYLEKLSGHGLHFHILSFEKAENFHKENKHIAQVLAAAGIEWHPLTYTKNPPVLSTIYDLEMMKREGKRLIRKHNISILHCRSYISGIAGLFLQRKCGVRFIFDMRGFYADERIDGGLWNLNNPVYRSVYNYFKRKESEMLRMADAVVCLTEAGKVEIDSWKIRPADKDPVRVIPCCADLDLFNPGYVKEADRENLKRQLQLDNSGPLISYLGSIGTWYLPDEMLEFFSHLLKSHRDAIFLFITPDEPSVIRSLAKTRGIPDNALRFYSARRQEVPVALSLSDASLFFIKPVFSKKASSPTKQGEIMGMGIPLICNAGVGDTDDIVHRYGSGMIIDLKRNNAMQTAVDNFDSLKNIPPEKIIRGAQEYFSLDHGVQKYLEIYKKVLITNF